jgi:hypothetical protein
MSDEVKGKFAKYDDDTFPQILSEKRIRLRFTAEMREEAGERESSCG